MCTIQPDPLARPANAGTCEGEALAALFLWFSPSMPTGAFAYSHGVEAAVFDGRICGGDDLGAWLKDLLEVGSAWSDAILLSLAYRAADLAEMQKVAELAASLAPSKERLLETLAQGRAFLISAQLGWPSAMPPGLSGEIAFPVAAGVASAGMRAPLAFTLLAYLNSFCANLVAVGIRLALFGQVAGIQILASLHPTIAAVALRAEVADESDLGCCALFSDIATMRHEHLPSRLFIS